MAKSKNAPALFEMLQQQKETRHRTGLALPRWWKNLQEPGAAGEPAEDVSQSEALGASQEGPSAELSSAPRATGVASSADASREVDPERPAIESGESQGVPTAVSAARNSVRFANGRFELSLNPIGAAVVAGGVVLALFMAYQVGKRAAPSRSPVTAADARPGVEPGLDVSAVRQGEPDSSVLVDLRGTEQAPPVPARSVSSGVEPVAGKTSGASKAEVSLPAAPARVASARVHGLNYIIVERFHTGLPQVKSVEEADGQARQAQKWLAERCGLQTAIYPMSNGKGFELWTAQGFKHPEETPQREELADRIRSFGKLYAKEGNNYLFSCQGIKY